MEKQFQEVFPDLRIEGGMAELLDTVEVSRVSINKKKDLLRIYVVSHQWIHKKYIYQLERQIEEQLFSNVPLRVKIIERFYLSRQYTPENFLEVYRPSILLELKNHSVFLNHLFSTAEITFPETNKMHLVLVDSVVAKEREEELVHILEKIFCERCGFDLIVETEMRKPEGESRAMRNSELRIREEVRHVLAHTHYGEMLGEKEQNRMEEQAEAAGEQPKAAAAAKGGEAKKEKAADGGRGKGFSGGGRGSFKKGKGSFSRNADNQPRKSSNPDVLYGRDFEDESVEILKIGDEIGDVVIRGRVQSVDMREIRNERTIFMFTITDFTDTIGVKIFVQNAEVPELKDAIKKGAFIKVKGKTTVDAFDHDLTVMSVWGIKKITDFRTGRQDTSPVKRVELHCHTKMSDMDGVTDAARLVQRAYEWGHPAIAITDHGVVQSFPEANHAIEAIDGAYRKKYQAEHPDATKDELKKVSAPFKVIYGMEAYLVDDLKDIVVNSKGQDIHGSYVVFDIETTGFSPVVNKIIEIGAVRVENGAIVDKFSTFVNPKVPIPFRIENLTGINDNMVLDAPDIETVLPKFLEFSEGAVMVAHNASFDMSFIEHNCVLQGIEREFTTADTVAMARFLLPGLNRFKLDTVAKAVGVSLENHHRAVDDAGCTAEIFVKFVKMLEERNILTLDDLNAQGKVSEEAVRKLPSYHAIILAKNETGRVNLYRLVSESHLKYYNRRPKLPKSIIDVSRLTKGMVLVTGPAGSGKSTTLACIIDEINRTRNAHVITLEDPIEYLHRHKMSVVTQREIVTDTDSYVSGLRASLRQAPDVILLGEMRDYETISIAMTAAETGHLILSTLHTVGAANTIDRVIDAFPPNQQQQIRTQLAMVLDAVISQQLIPTLDGGVQPAFEIMFLNNAIRNMIRESKIHQIDGIIATSQEEGMVSMDNSLIRLYRDGVISRENAVAYSSNSELMEKKLSR